MKNSVSRLNDSKMLHHKAIYCRIEVSTNKPLLYELFITVEKIWKWKKSMM